ncbi:MULTISPECIES: MFS transporter [unclassified Streptomyces]|uniref:MFS transporter n=1 Tax=unclassified Streptomyces TaxID=2593676 RepID=UPI00226F6D13|nr:MULTISPECIES: MFS transporter [unclassified Streptomyces]MCY0919965.1 MFS transporter [Streptomyces sp. H27-G5]MCY0959509.1 MFS transporter [Streptomyces sp. H27-H5]
MTSAVTTDTSARPGYGQLLRTPGALGFLLPGFAARLPFGMLTISILLLVQHTTGSYANAGIVAAVTGISMALCAPLMGNLTDRHGQSAVLLPVVLIHSAAVTGLAALALAGAPVWALAAAAIPAGASVPQVGPMVRARWAAKLEGSPLLPTAAAFESVTDEFTFVVGPVLATALCTGIHPAAGLITEATLSLLGGLLFAAQRRTQPPAHVQVIGEAKRVSALTSPGLRVLIVAFLGIGAVFGGMQVSLAAFSNEIGNPGANGLLYGVFAAGNMIAGIACGAIAWKIGPRRRLLFGYIGLTAFASLLWTADSMVMLAALGLFVGLCIAPALITGYTMVESLIPANARTEAFTWLTGAVAFGQAIAVIVAGRLTDAHGSSYGFLVPLAATALALVTLLALRSKLAPKAPSRIVNASSTTESATEADSGDTPENAAENAPETTSATDAETVTGTTARRGRQRDLTSV